MPPSAAFERPFPLAKIVEAQLHTRESQWQVRITTQPRGINYRGVVRCSKDAIVREAVATLTGARGQKVRRERKRDCSTIQDAFYNLCGAPFGLGRGTPESDKAHKDIKAVERAKAVLEQ